MMFAQPTHTVRTAEWRGAGPHPQPADAETLERLGGGRRKGLCVYPSARSRAMGFTIIELLIVITLIGLLAGLALPRIDYQKMRMDATLRGVGIALVAAQRSAVTRQHNVIVLIDANANSIRVHDDRNNDQVVDTDERTRGVPMGDNVVIGRGTASPHSIGAAAVTFTKEVGGTPALTFYRNGSASELGGFYLTSRRHVNNGDHVTDTKLVVIERSTGRVEWFSYNGSTWVRGF